MLASPPVVGVHKERRHSAATMASRISALLVCSVLAGCGSGVTSAPAPAPAPPPTYNGVSFTATVRAGTTPVIGAGIQLFAAGTSGNASAPTALLANLASTDANGAATIPATYNCPSGNSLLYLVATEGTVSGANSVNQNLELVTPIGPCSAITSASKFTVNEATTVAAAVALGPFSSPGAAIGASATNSTGLMNAFATAATLADPVTGAVPGSTLPANVVAPVAAINSLANLIHACLVAASDCPPIYSAVGTATSVPANTLDALQVILKSPTSNVAAVFSLTQASSVYAPALAAAPSDWSLFETIKGAGLNNPTGIGVDSTGAVWVANYFYAASKFSPTGAAVFSAGVTGDGLNNSYGLAVDGNDHVWIPNEQPFTNVGIGSVTELSSSGTSLAGNGFLNGGLDYPISLAIDPNGTVWVVDYGDSRLTLLNSSGTPLSGQNGYSGPSFAFPDVVAVDQNHFGWVGNQADSRVTKVSPDGSAFTSYDCCDGASGIAVDQQNDVWIANFYGNSVSLISASGVVISHGTYTGLNSLDRPQGIAIDGAGNVWVANYRAPYLTELAGSQSASPGTSLTPAGGLGGDAELRGAFAIAVDASGSLWVSNQGSNSVTRFIGTAVPVKTPLLGVPVSP